jgi:hypothetical protein
MSTIETLQAFVESAEIALERVAATLPDTFPERVFTKIASGLRRQAASFLRTSKSK